MKTKQVAAAAVIAAFAGTASAGFVFNFEGTVLGGSSMGTDLTGEAFTFSIVVDDVSTDLTPTSSITSFSISSLTMTVGGSTEQLSSGYDPDFSSLFIDPGSTQLVAAQSLFGDGVTFVVGALLPDGSFADLGDVGGTGDFTVGDVGGTTGNYNSTVFEALSLGIGGFGFQNTGAVIPLPPPALLAGAGLVGVVGLRRSR